MAALVSLIVSHLATVTPPQECLVCVRRLPECGSLSGIVGSWLVVRSAPWTGGMASGLRGARHLRRRSSSTDVPDNVPESHTAAHLFPVLARNRCLMYRVIGHYPGRFSGRPLFWK